MTLKERYSIKKRKVKQFLNFYIIIIVILSLVHFSLAKYKTIFESNANIEVAKWKISLNGVELTNDSNDLSKTITLVPDTKVNKDNPNKISSGQSGHFDIIINPSGTEVSFDYEIKIDLLNSNLPKKLKIEEYSIGENAEKKQLENNTFRNTMNLKEGKAFTEADTQTIRFYWNWEKEDSIEINENYSIIAEIEIQQIISN